MPIRFRCVYCDQLLGIARRKAGAVVNCPKCHKQLMVPQPEPEPASASAGAAGPAPVPGSAAPPAPAAPAPVFERDDFDQLLESPAPLEPLPPVPSLPTERAMTSPPPARRPATPAPPAPEPLGVELAASPAGIVLSRTAATWLSVAAVLALAVAFSAGLLIGLLLRPSGG